MEERLQTLRESFVIKRKQVDSQQELAESLTSENECLRNEFPPPSLITAKRLELVTKQHQQAVMQERIAHLEQNAKQYSEKIAVLEEDLSIYLKAYQELQHNIAVEERYLFAFQQHARDVLNMPRERFLMCREELRTICHKMDVAIEADRPTAQTEFLKRVIKTTKIQRREKEVELAAAEKNLEAKSMSLQQHRS